MPSVLSRDAPSHGACARGALVFLAVTRRGSPYSGICALSAHNSQLLSLRREQIISSYWYAWRADMRDSNAVSIGQESFSVGTNTRGMKTLPLTEAFLSVA